MQGLFKSTENHILAWLLHLQLRAPLFRFQKHLNDLVLVISFLGIFFWKRHVRLLEVYVRATWHGIFTMHMLIEV